MQTYTRHTRWLVVALILTIGLSGCFRSAGGSLEPTPGNVSLTAVANNTPLPMPTFTPPGADMEQTPTAVVQVPSDTPVISAPTMEEMTEPPSPIPASPAESFQDIPTQPPTLVPSATPVPWPTDTETPVVSVSVGEGQGGPVSTGPTPTDTAVVVAVVPSPTTVPPTEPPTWTPTFTQPPTWTPTFTQPPTLTQPPSLTPAPVQPLAVAAGPTATFTSVPFNTLPPSPTYTPYRPPQEAMPLAERPTETLPPAAPAAADGQGGPVGETPQAVAQVPTLTNNQITATAIVFNATATAAAAQGTFFPIETPGVVQPGQPTQAGLTPLAPAPAVPTQVPGICGEHLISPGENLYRIALQYNVTINQMAQANNIVNPDLIKAGDTLIVPCPVPATATPFAPDGQGGQATVPTTGPMNYIVEPGDNLYRISLRFGVSMAELMRVNGMTPATINMIYAGQELYIPASTMQPVQPTPTWTPQQIQPQQPAPATG
ncbi:MAG: LysM peptidoglycan-binding domain-containing protein [Anaerolineae bacterium]|nr:LysM peptidoglycan-binding domain-containing protein [Anaerolineae bacterium]